MLKPGDKAPDFSLPDQTGTTVRLKDLRGSTVVLYFYPKDMTPGCTQEACDFNDGFAALRKKGAVILGVSGDDAASHRKFADKFGLKFRLLSDTDKSTIKAYGAWQKKSMYGRTFMGIVRSTFIIDEQGRVRAVFPKVKVRGHVEEVLKALE